MHPYVCSSTISNSQDMEAAYMPTGKRMDKEDVCMCVCVCVCMHVYVHIYKWNATQPETENETVSFAATWMD